MFTQENTSTSRTFGGTGLGLAIAKRLTDLLGGEIGFESEKNVGSLFWVSVPLVAVDPDLALEEKLISPRQKSPNEFAHCRVLLVEDNDVNRMVAGGMLKNLGIAYDVALNGVEAVEKVLRNTYNLVLMDCEMPEMDGYQATRNIRAYEQNQTNTKTYPTQSIPIVALTANAMSHDRQRCIESGMNGFIVKPLKMDVLHAVIAEYIL